MNSQFQPEAKRGFLHALNQCAISFDQFVNTFISLFFPGAWRDSWADETLSCRAWRAFEKRKWLGLFWRPVIDLLFLWQKQPEGVRGHCHGAYLNEKKRYGFPPEMR